jgi:hypothetical protein
MVSVQIYELQCDNSIQKDQIKAIGVSISSNIYYLFVLGIFELLFSVYYEIYNELI